MIPETFKLAWPIIGIASIGGLGVAGWLIAFIFAQPKGSDKMQEVAKAIREGAYSFLKRQYTTIAILAIVVAAILYFVPIRGEGNVLIPGWLTATAFLLGAACSALAGMIGMYTSVEANLRTANAAITSLNKALQISFRGGAVTGIAVVALSLIGVGGLYLLVNLVAPDLAHGNQAPFLIVGYAFGASFVALFAQLGGGIYTKAADVGADIIGKIEAGVPEDDPQNPAVVADLVGDNVGDCAGRGADLFESTAAENIGAMILGVMLYPVFGLNGILFPLAARAFGLMASIIGVFLVRTAEDKDPMDAMNRAYGITSVFCIVGLGIATYTMLNTESTQWLWLFAAGVIGVIMSFVFVYLTTYYTDLRFGPVKRIAKSAETGHATVIIEGSSVGMESTLYPVIAIGLSILLSFLFGQLGMPSAPGLVAGLYGTAIATMGMLSTCAFILAMDTFGPITDNAGGIAQFSGQPEEVRERTDRLDSCGNSTKAITKGYAVGSAALAAFLLFQAYIEKVIATSGGVIHELPVDLGEPAIFVGAFVGAMVVFAFCAFAIRAVGRAAQDIIVEVRRQIKEKNIFAKENPGKPEYGPCVDIVTRAALREMVLPGAFAVLAPVVVGVGIRIFAQLTGSPDVFMGAKAAAAYLMVVTIAGVVMALYLNNGGGAWDNAKKLIETGAHGGKGSDAHKAGVTGDTVGDPFKDTAGPSLHVLMKLASTITLVLAALFIAG
ncbi:MAG: sodium-translocating pyrophosphatase [bacterium]